MDSKFSLSKNLLWWEIAILRYVVLVGSVLIVLAVFLAMHQLASIEWVKEQIQIILDKIDEERGLRFFIFTTSVGLALFGFKKLLSDKIDTFIGHIRLKDFPTSLKSVIFFESSREKKKYLTTFIKENSKHQVPIKFVRLLFLTSIPVLIASYTWEEKKEGSLSWTSFKSNEYSLKNRNQVSSPFKISINFEHEDDDLKIFGKDEIQTLEKMLTAFKGCLIKEEKHALLVIRGFVSETKLDKISEEIDLANRRANNTKEQIDEILKKDFFKSYAKQIEIVVEEWDETTEDYLRMIESRIFIEVKSDEDIKLDSQEKRDYTSEYLNRRVEISIVKAGDCYP